MYFADVLLLWFGKGGPSRVFFLRVFLAHEFIVVSGEVSWLFAYEASSFLH